jgi:benzoyl-CoA 2,3-epoxidase subunit B
LFGSEVSSNAAASFANGIKGRPDEETASEDHDIREASFSLESPGGREDVPLRNALNEVVREAYIRDCEVGLRLWNRTLAKSGSKSEIRLPSPRFNRTVGVWAGQPVDPTGALIPADAWAQQKAGWLPSDGDRAFVKTLMQRVVEPGKVAGWIAPPERGVGTHPPDYEYVRL